MTETSHSTAGIDQERVAIDGLDGHIIELLARRARISARIQQSRMNAGGPRTELSREMDVLARYRNGLGPYGTQVAMSILKLCRGAGPQELLALTAEATDHPA
ncbi:chorismate mutase [Streptomyces sp. NPDC007355]|uniref:chorismate mutase n=1 Tax=Streptomyces sp. NPDC007355 TaxID=3364778 RepID=UPI0036BA2E55